MGKKAAFIAGSLVLISLLGLGYYYFYSKTRRPVSVPNISIEEEEQSVSCEQLKDIPSVEYVPAEVKEQFSKCFPERVGGAKPPVPTPTSSSLEVNSSNCAPFTAMPGAQYCSTVTDSNGRVLCEQCKVKGY